MSLDLTDYVSIGSGNGFVPSGSIEQAITWANIDLTLCRHMVSQGHDDEAMAIVIFKLWQLEPLGYKNQMLVIIVTDVALVLKHQGPLLLKWINFNPSMDK